MREEAARVVLVANSRDPGSAALARYYAAQRGVPLENLVELPMSEDETVTWPVFTREIYNPLQEWLVARGWIDAVPGSLTDKFGRTRIAPAGHRIAYLIVFRGVPLRISHDASLLEPAMAAKLQEQFKTNQASVDGELAQLAAIHTEINGAIKNPLYQVRAPTLFQSASVVRVARIDGPSASGCERMIRSAIEAEAVGLAGRVYVDLGGRHPMGDGWLGSVADQYTALGFDVDRHTARTVMNAFERFDAPAVYAGWYAGDLNGPFQLRGFRFPPGAVAVHIHSFSARTLRSVTAGWCGPLVHLGAAATVGNVFEPYLEFTHHLDLFFEALSRGATLGEAGYYSLPGLSWQAVLLGDPLYRPFAVSHEEALARLDGREDEGAAHVVLREFNRLERQDSSNYHGGWLERAESRHPAPALTLRLAAELDRSGDRAGALLALKRFTTQSTVHAQDLAVFLLATELCARLGSVDDAVTLFRSMLASPFIDDAWQRHLLPRAIEAAEQAGNVGQQEEWQRELAGLRRP